MAKTSRALLELENTFTLEGALRRIDALTLQISPSMQALQRMTDSARSLQRMTDSLRLQEPLTDSLQRMTDSARSLQRMTDSLRLQEPLTDSLQRMTDSARSLQRMTDSLRLQEPLTDSLQRMTDSARSLQRMTDSARLTALALQDSPAMKALREFSNLPFSSAERERVFSALGSLKRTQPDPEEYPDFPIDQDIQLEIQRELEGNKDYKALSERAQAFLLYVYHYYLLPILINCIIVPIIIAHTQRVQTELQENKTPAEIRSYVRKPVPGVNKELLRGYRVVTGSNVHLRKEPNMKSEIITKLPLGKLIEVRDKSNRSWLHVEVDIEEERFVGWISRRYTTYFK